MKKSFIVSVITLGVIAVFSVSCGKKLAAEKAEKDKVEAERKYDREQIAVLIKRHNAFDQWHANLPQRGINGPFTYDLKKTLMPSNGVPVLLVMELTDVNENNGQFRAEFSHSYYKNGFFELAAEVKCTAAQTSELLAHNVSLPRSFAIVAVVTEVTRPAFSVQGTGNETEVEVNTDGKVFLLKAECVDLVKLQNPFDWISE